MKQLRSGMKILKAACVATSVILSVNMFVAALGFSDVHVPNRCFPYSGWYPSEVEFMECVNKIDNINAYNNEGKGLLHIAFERKFSPQVILALLNKGVNVAWRDNTGETSLFYACQTQEKNISKRQTKIDAHSLFSALVFVNESDIKDKINQCLANGADINAVDKNGDTLLHKVCKEKRSFDLFLFLLNKGANYDTHDSDGKTPLHYMYKNQQYDCLENPDDKHKIPLHLRTSILLCKRLTKAVYSIKQFNKQENRYYIFFKTGLLDSVNKLAAIVEYVKDENGVPTIVVAFRGSINSYDVTVDGMAVQAEIKDDSNHIFPNELHKPEYGIHSGFLWRYAVLSNEIRCCIRELLIKNSSSVSDTKFYFTGHSLGGALASICIIDMQNHFQIKRQNAHLVTFAAPRVYNESLAKKVSTLISAESYRFYILGDQISSLPPESLGWRHVGRPIAIKETNINLGDAAASSDIASSFQKISHQTRVFLNYKHSTDRFDAALKNAFSEK